MKEVDRPDEQPEHDSAHLRQRIAELEAILEYSRDLSSDLALEPLLKKVLAAATVLIGGESATILLRDTPAGELSLLTAYDRESGELSQFQISVPAEGSITGALATADGPLTIPDVHLDPRCCGEVDHPGGWETRSLLGVPLITHGYAIGVLAVHSDRPDRFTPDHVRLAAAFAGQAALAVEGSRLFQAERAQAQRQAALFRLSAELNATLDERQVCRQIVVSLRDILGYDAVALYLVDEVTGDRVTAAFVGSDHPPARIPPGLGLSELPLLDGRLRYTPDAAQDSRHIPGLQGSEVDVPIRIGEKTLGVLNVERAQPHAFSQDDLEVLTAVAQQAGLAIEKARLLATERRRADELETLRTTMTEIAAKLELSDLLQAIVERAVALLDATGGEVGLYDPANQEIEIVVCHGMGRDYVGTRLALDEGAMGQVAITREPMIIEDYDTWEDRSPQYAELCMHAGLVAPLEVAGRLVGAVDIGTSDPERRFGPADLNLLNLLAQQAAIAIENARLFGESERRLKELATLTDIGQALSSTLQVKEVVELIGDQVQRVISAKDMLVMLYDQSRHEIECVLSTREQVAPGDRWPADWGLTGNVIKHRRSLLLRGEDTVKRAREMGAIIIGGGSASALSVPMLRGKRVLGVISVYDHTDEGAYDESHQVLLETIANQAAVAIENARLFGETERRVAELATLTEIGQALSSTLRVDDILQLVYQQARRVMNAEDMIIALYDEEHHELEVALSSDPEDIPVGTRTLADTTLSGYVIKRRKPILLRDNVLERTLELGLDPVGRVPASALAVPMLSGERVLGAIVVQHYTIPNVFDTSHQALLQTLASQAAIAIDNARLYDKAEREIADRVRAEAELLKYQEDLEGLVEARTAELRTSEERHRTLFDGVPTGLYRSTPSGQILDANPALVQMLGYSNREDLLAIHLDKIYVDQQERARWKDQVEREGMIRDSVIRMYQRDGTIIWVNNTARAVRDDKGRVLQYEGSLEDITERRTAAIELQKYQGHLEELVEERTAELAKSEERYRTLFDGVPVGLYRSTPEGKILDVSPAFVQLLGYPSRQELLAVANTAALYVDPEERDRWQALMERKGVVRDFPVRVRRYDGTTIWLGDTARTVKDEQGQVLHYEGSLEDISRRKRYEHEIRRQKEYFEALFVNSPVAVVTADLNGNVVSWSPAAETLFGYSPEEAIGRHLDDLVANDPRFREEAAALTRQAIQGVRTKVTTRRTRKDGSVVDVELRGLPVIMADEEVGFIVIYHDITERRRFEEELRRQKEYYEALFVNSPVAVVTADLDACVVSWSPAAEKLFGYAPEEALGQCLDDLVANDPRLAEEAVHLTNQAINAIRVRATAQRTHRDGSLVDVEILALPVIVGEETVGFIVIYHDITSLQEARRQAEAASDAKSAFLASMSHELRTPLNAILGFTQLMDRDANLTTEQRENLGIINRSGEHLLALINDVLEMSKIEAGQVELQETTFDLYHLLDGLEEMFALRTEAKGLKLSFGRADSVPQFVRGDESKLRQVLVNLLGNAVKFTREGVIKLHMWSREHRAPTMRNGAPYRSVLHFKVKDTGPGMGPEELAVIFDPFVQATSGRESHEGSGLGLSISRKSVRLMGGDLTVSSEPGSGTIFRFDVPIEAVPLGAAEVQAARVARRVLALAPNQPTYRLLIAEDKAASRKLLVRLLEPLGFEVEAVANGQQAFEVWKRWAPHLIWMDIRMPIMDGHEATNRIRALQQSRTQPATQGKPTVIIALTATAFDEDRERALSEGCDDYVRKPFRHEEIYDMLAKHLAVRFVYEEASSDPAAARPAGITVPVTAVTAPAAAVRDPAEWAADLERATLRADMSLILTLIEEIRGQNAPLAYALAKMAHSFEYKEILAHVQQIGEQR